LAERYDFEIDDVFAIQDELARSIPAALNIKVEEVEQLRALAKPPASLDAYDLFLRGRHLELSYNRADRVKAKELFLGAIKVDPMYAQAYLRLAWFEITNLKWNESADLESSLATALDAALKAVEFDSTAAESEWALGVTYLWKRDADRAIACYERALALAPNHCDLLADFCDSLTYVGRFAEAIELGKTALRLNPNQPDWYSWNVAAGYYLSGQYDDALRYLERMAQLGPAYRLLAATYAQLGRPQDARRAAAELLKINPQFSVSRFAAQEPYRRSEDLARYVAGLRLAGLPE
jgi:adenylate cyclase